MGNCMYKLEDCVVVQRHVRKQMETATGLTVMQAYEQAVATLAAQAPQGHPAGWRVNANNELVRIKHSTPTAQGGGGTKEKIAKPLSVATITAVDNEPEAEPVLLPPPTSDDREMEPCEIPFESGQPEDESVEEDAVLTSIGGGDDE